jgi:hypothetical protein
MSCDCGCECCSEEREPTPEELAEMRERELMRLELRMIPARSPMEQLERDLEQWELAMVADIERSFFEQVDAAALAGLASWLPMEDPPCI